MREAWLVLDSRGMGGIESHVAELAAGLAAAGEHPSVVFLADYGPHPLRRRLDADGIAHCTLRGGVRDLIGRMRLDRPRVLHTHGYKANLLGRLAALACGVPQVATYHAGERPFGRLALYDAVDRWTAFCGRRIAVSRPIAARLPFAAKLIPNFVAVPPRAAAGGASQVIGFAGRLSPEKGPDIFAGLAARHPGAAFRLFGDGPMRAAMQVSAPGNLALMGAVDGMGPHWAALGLLVISSRAEGLPLAALEAMAHGVPVAAFALGGLPELITDGVDGFLAPPADVAALSAAIGRFLALDGAARAALSGAARSRVIQGYSRATGVAATRALYPD